MATKKEKARTDSWLPRKNGLPTRKTRVAKKKIEKKSKTYCIVLLDMLPKNIRLNLRSSADIFRIGKRISFPCGSIYFSPSPTFKGAVVVTKKYSLFSVERNRMKRILRIILRDFILDSMKNKSSPLEVVVFVNKTSKEHAEKTVKDECSKALQRIKQ